jgi:GTP-binding protein Era
MSEARLLRCGFVAIIGRPNVGKSTLLNRIVGQKISITSPRPQTTRHRILGIKSDVDSQVIYVDTPGLHPHGRRALNRYLNRAASAALRDVDVLVFLVAGTRWTHEDQAVLTQLRGVAAPVILAVNKIDKVTRKKDLLPHIEFMSGLYDFRHVVLISALRSEGMERLECLVRELLPSGTPLFPAEQVTDRSERFLAAELVREKLTRRLDKELPYALTVEIERFTEEKALLRVDAVIWVARPSQKSIVIGRGGSVLKLLGRQAREEMEAMFGRKVFLRLWVKVKEGWSDDDRLLRGLGYMD